MIHSSKLASLAAVGTLIVAGCVDSSNNEAPGATTAAAPESSVSATASSLQSRLALLQHRQSLIDDANEVKRLQRAYGYYLDKALWDEVTDLFAEDGSIEIGLDGVYRGKDRVRSYLYALGDGHQGLAEGHLNEHMQLMGVVSVSPDGLTARARWRDIIMAGELGGEANWGEGPYENEYVKEGGIWKLKTVHWYQSMVVPYAGGWQVNPDVNSGKWVPYGLPPDAPPTVVYETWPGTYLPPFHFPNPVLEHAEVDLAEVLGLDSSAPDAVPMSELVERAAVLSQEVELLEDENAIENLQRVYGFYIDKGFWSEAADLFAQNATIEVGNSGVYVGKDRVLQFLRSRGIEFPQEGRLYDRMQLQPIVHVAPDGRTAKARWRLFAQEAMWGEFANWGVGVYENEYVKENGAWKIQSLHLYYTMYTSYEDGWGVSAEPGNAPSDALPPDRPSTVANPVYPATFVPPFHYGNPVTGDPVFEESPSDYAASVSAEDLEATLNDLDRRLTRLEDFDQLERLNAVYGYYLARNQWDDFAGIFSKEGTIEIAMRGVYVGPASVRRNLDLYGEAGVQHGLLHNHMQYQPVITLAEDGLSAKMRSRALSIMGQFEQYSMWMGGVYENDYIKEDGIWKILHDQVFNTYFVPYAMGWKDAPRRPPPGISESNPPDLPPTHPFEMYPAAFLPPFHYPNPVTGNAVIWPPE